MSSYSSLLSMGSVDLVGGGYVDDGYNDDADDMVVAASYLSSFDFDVGEEYASLPEAAAALHAEQQTPAPLPVHSPQADDADGYNSGKAASTSSEQHTPAPAPLPVHSPQADADGHKSGKAASTSSDGLCYEDSIISKSLTSGVARSKCSKIAFKTRSEVEVLDDGYRWRKYGKKMVKNSPNPRNYYRCSSEGCRVKKRVEREREPRGCAGYSLAQTRVDEGSWLPMEGRRCFLDTMKMHAVGAGNGGQHDCTPAPAPRAVQRDS